MSLVAESRSNSVLWLQYRAERARRNADEAEAKAQELERLLAEAWERQFGEVREED